MKQKLGRQEMQFFAYVQMRNFSAVRTGDLQGPLRLTARQESKLLSRLAQASMIARVWRGFYLVPPRLPLGGKWTPDEILALNTLMQELQGRYQICGPNAFNRYGFDEQVPNRIYAYNNRVSGNRTVGSVALVLIKVRDDRLGSTESIQTTEGLAAIYSSRARTLVDAVYDWSRFGSLPRAYEWIRRELKAKRITETELVSTTLKFGDKGTIRRVGVLLEQENVTESLLRRLRRAVPKSTSLIPWIPTLPKRGTVNREWGVVVNEQT